MTDSAAIAFGTPRRTTRRVSRSIGRFRGVGLDPPEADSTQPASVPVPESRFEPAPTARAGLLALVGIAAAAVNLRTGVTSLGAVLPEVRTYWELSGLMAGLLTAFPVATFAAVGAATPALARWLGVQRLTGLAMLAAAAGLLLRAIAGSVAVFLAASVVAMAGAAIGNVLLPSLVKRYFPHRIGGMTALCTTTLAIGMTAGAALTVPIERAAGGDWRTGLGAWAVFAALAVLPWLALGFRDHVPATGQRRRTAPRHSPLARALTVYFGCQSLNAYAVLGWLPGILADAGLDAAAASQPLAVFSALSIPMSLLLPPLAARLPHQGVLVFATTASSAAGYLGLIAAPGTAGWLWGALLGVGNGAFPLAVTLIGLRSGDPELTIALSGMAQSGGYLLAVLGPLLVGVLHGATGSWTAPLAVLLATLGAQLLSGWRAARPGTVEQDPDTARHPGLRTWPRRL